MSGLGTFGPGAATVCYTRERTRAVMKKKKASPVPKKRNLAAKQSRDQKAGPMQDKRKGRGGARNTFAEDFSQTTPES